MRCKTPKIRTPRSTLSEATHSRNCNSFPSHCTNGHQFRNTPITKINNVLFITFLQNTACPASCNLGMTNAMAFPTANKKKGNTRSRSEEHTSELQSRENLVCRLLLEKKNS